MSQDTQGTQTPLHQQGFGVATPANFIVAFHSCPRESQGRIAGASHLFQRTFACAHIQPAHGRERVKVLPLELEPMVHQQLAKRARARCSNLMLRLDADRAALYFEVISARMGAFRKP